MNGRRDRLISLLKRQVRPAFGCTEPAAIALAVSRAQAEVPGAVLAVRVRTSGNVFKNADCVGIPGASDSGIPFVAALALVCGQAPKGLEVFANVTAEAVSRARELENSCAIDVDVVEGDAAFYIEAHVRTVAGDARCIIRHTHTNVELVEKNGEQVFRKEDSQSRTEGDAFIPILKDMTISTLRQEVEAMPLEELTFLLDGVPMNRSMAEMGLKERPGLALGAALQDMMNTGELENNLINKVRTYSAAAADAFMAGLNQPIMSSAGSGNHGIIAILPPYMVCTELGLGEVKLIRGLAFSHLITIAIKEFSGSVSAVCGCAIAAGIGASVAVAWLLDCTDEQIAGAISSMGGTLAGMLCDGAKGGCAFKLSNAAGEAVLNAMLAKRGIFIPHGQGIVDFHVETTIQNIARISTQGMKGVDLELIDVMMSQ